MKGVTCKVSAHKRQWNDDEVGAHPGRRPQGGALLAGKFELRPCVRDEVPSQTGEIVPQSGVAFEKGWDPWRCLGS